MSSYKRVLRGALNRITVEILPKFCIILPKAPYTTLLYEDIKKILPEIIDITRNSTVI